MQYQLFIGANNQTGLVEVDKIENLVSLYVDGFTIVPCHGYWNGNREDSVQLLLTLEPVQLDQLINKLKKELEQEAIAYSEAPALVFV